MSGRCKHSEGDTINGQWVCAACYVKLPERPRTYYRPVKVEDVYSDQPVPPQEIILAPIATHDGVTLSQFVNKMATRLVAATRGSMSMSDATDYAVDLLKSFDEKFGDPSMCWDAAGAWEIIDEDLHYWDADESASNS